MKKHRIVNTILAVIVCISLIPVRIYGNEDDGKEALEQEISWPEAPEIFGHSAILVDADTGAVLYEKNPDEKMYPASITKVLTALIAIENASLDDIVTFSDNAINSLPYDAAKVGIVPGEQVKLLDCLYALILRSGNEVANGLAEHVSGDIDSFAKLMNDYATEIGAVNSHFENPSGLHDDNHYITARDYSIIIREAVKNDVLCKVWGTSSYKMPATNKNQAYSIWHRHSMLVDSRPEYYKKAVGGKTGYTGKAGNTLVTYAKDGDLSLICIVLKSDSKNVYSDTEKLLEYGFTNFEKQAITNSSLGAVDDNTGFFAKYQYMFEDSDDIISFDRSNVVVPKGTSISQFDKVISYPETVGSDGVIANINFFYDTLFLGETSVILVSEDNKEPIGPAVTNTEKKEEDNKTITVIDIKYVLFTLAGIAALVLIIVIVRLTAKKRKTRRGWTKRVKGRGRRYRGFK